MRRLLWTTFLASAAIALPLAASATAFECPYSKGIAGSGPAQSLNGSSGTGSILQSPSQAAPWGIAAGGVLGLLAVAAAKKGRPAAPEAMAPEDEAVWNEADLEIEIVTVSDSVADEAETVALR